MGQVGRPLERIGVRAEDLRLRFRSSSGRTRGFYARWRPRAQVWECQVSGFGMRPRCWFSSSQTLALSNLRFIQSLWTWKAETVDRSPQWDGVTDLGFYVKARRHGELQLDLFHESTAGGLACATQPN